MTIAVGLPIAAVGIFLRGWKLRTWGPILLLLAISLSPRFSLGQIAEGRAVDIRVEDLLLLFLVPLWLGRGRCSLARPFFPSIASYLCIASVSTWIGILMGWVNAVASVFFFLKEVEYFLIFFFVADSVQNKEQVKGLLGAFILLGLVDLGWKLAQLAFSIPFPDVPNPPFEYDADAQGAAAAAFSLAIAMGLFVTGTARQRVVSIFLVGAFSISLLVTLKRSFIATGLVVFVLLGLLSMFRLRTWRYVVLGVVGIASLAAGYAVAEKFGLPARAGLTQAGLTQYQVETMDLAERGQIWQDHLQGFFRNPILGVGKGSLPAGGAHNFYVLLLSEVGALGLLAYMWVWISMGRVILNIYRAPPDPVSKWLAVSWLLATAFIAVANMFGEYLLTVRPAESYWFLSGLAVGMARLAWARSSTAPDRPGLALTAAS